MGTLLFSEAVGVAGETTRIASSDTAQDLFDDGGLSFKNDDGKDITSAMITVEDYDVRFAFVADADQTGSAEVGHVVAAGNSFMVFGPRNLRALTFINKTAQSDGVLQVTPRYGY